jgi:hypothetical protein
MNKVNPYLVNRYSCKHCGAIVERNSDKAWIKSWCDKMGKDVHLKLIKNDIST